MVFQELGPSEREICEHQKIGVEMKTCFAVFLNLPTQHVLQHSAVNSILHSGQVSGVFLISTTEKDGETNLNIDRGKSRLGHFLFVFHDGDWLDNLVGRGPHAWVERGQSHGNHRRDKSGISAEIVSVKGGGGRTKGRPSGLEKELP